MSRLEDAERILTERVAGGRIGAGARPAADGVIFAIAAAPVELSGSCSSRNTFEVAINLGQAVRSDVSGYYRKKSGGADVAGV